MEGTLSQREQTLTLAGILIGAILGPPLSMCFAVLYIGGNPYNALLATGAILLITAGGASAGMLLLGIAIFGMKYGMYSHEKSVRDTVWAMEKIGWGRCLFFAAIGGEVVLLLIFHAQLVHWIGLVVGWVVGAILTWIWGIKGILALILGFLMAVFAASSASYLF